MIKLNKNYWNEERNRRVGMKVELEGVEKEIKVKTEEEIVLKMIFALI